MNEKAVPALAGIVVLMVAAVAAFILHQKHWTPLALSIQGAVIRQDANPRNRLPISGALVTATDGARTVTAHSDASGYFALTFRSGLVPRRAIDLHFAAPGYKPLQMQTQLHLRTGSGQLTIAPLTPLAPPVNPNPSAPVTVLSSIRVRYTVNTKSEENIGSAVRTFTVVHHGSEPCHQQSPCSPDGLWKASSGSITMDAGPGNEFRNVRASCIAGACPFTHVDASGFIQGGRTVTASATAWADTATILLEAEVFHSTLSGGVRHSYPVLYERTLTFTLPESEEGVSIEADVNGSPMVFPLGPELYLSWADCVMRTNSETEKSTVYRCELKPGYRF
ncbi:MAG: carboxypeptidase regulatory-like domain-containing protein [Acidobacteriota bacterium]|nr:carboxypeptidase regulatory-like domain-containing protein [Acidobacteriota bacterium]